MKDKVDDKSFFDFFKYHNVKDDVATLFRNADKVFDMLFEDEEEDEEKKHKAKCAKQEIEKEGFSFDGIKKIFGFDMDKLNVEEVKVYGDTKSNIIYVNGILTDKEDLREHINTLNCTFGTNIKAYHNETGGLLIDLLESSYGRDSIKRSPLAQQIAKSILEKLEQTTEELHLLGHSQGAILLNNALEVVQDQCKFEDLQRINFYTFGGALKHCILNNNMHIEHFANTSDIVPNLGILKEGVEHTGKIYRREASGHFFVDDYLMPVQAGEFGGESQFFKILHAEAQQTLNIKGMLQQKQEETEIEMPEGLVSKESKNKKPKKNTYR